MLLYFLGLDKIQDEIMSLKAQNAILASHVIDHKKTIGLMAINQAQALREILAMIEDISGRNKQKFSVKKHRKEDDDLVN